MKGIKQGGVIGLPKKFVSDFPLYLMENPNELTGQPNIYIQHLYPLVTKI